MKKYLLLLLIGIAQSHVFAEVSLNRTRLIIPESRKETNVQVRNEGNYPVLIQSWVDLGESNLAPELIVAPLLITAPMFRLEPKGAQLLRILLIDKPDQLPADQESVFWLNVQEIPQENIAKNDEKHIQIAFRSRIKIFYRPQKITENPNQLPLQLRFARIEQNGETFLRVQNPTPIHVTLLHVSLGSDADQPLATATPTDGMVGPQSFRLIPLNTIRPASTEEISVTYQFIDDYGRPVTWQQRLEGAD